MTIGHKLPLFVSSTHYGLQDLRAELTDFLESLGVAPYVSSEAGFPDYAGMPPYAGCLRALEHCLFVVGILDRRYGQSFDDWGPYPQYKGLSPTHAELRHALVNGKRLVVYVRDDVHVFYELFRKNPEEVAKLKLPDNLDLKALELYQELKLAKPAPWIEPFRDVRALKASLQQRLLNDLYELMLQRETTTGAAIGVITDAFLKSDRSLREAVLAAADKTTQAQIAQLDNQLVELEEKRRRLDAAHAETSRTEQELTNAVSRVTEERARLKLLINTSIAKLIAGAMTSGIQPAALRRIAGPDSLPLVSDQELAQGGIHFTGYSQSTPTVTKASWAKLPQQDPKGIWRGYDAALQVFGGGFAPGCKVQSRRRGSSEDPTFGWVPNIFSGHYLELSTNESEESAIGNLANEYRVVNPFGSKSAWVAFTYEIDIEAEVRKAMELFAQGEADLKAGNPTAATEPLRAAHVRLAGLVGESDERWKLAHSLWEESLYASGVWPRPPPTA